MPEESEPLVQLAGSERAPLPGVAPAGQLDTSERAELTLVLRRRAEIPADIVEGPTVLTSDQLAERYGADPADVDLVRQDAHRPGPGDHRGAPGQPADQGGGHARAAVQRVRC